MKGYNLERRQIWTPQALYKEGEGAPASFLPLLLTLESISSLSTSAPAWRSPAEFFLHHHHHAVVLLDFPGDLLRLPPCWNTEWTSTSIRTCDRVRKCCRIAAPEELNNYATLRSGSDRLHQPRDLFSLNALRSTRVCRSKSRCLDLIE
jgi:hypothetical protein